MDSHKRDITQKPNLRRCLNQEILQKFKKSASLKSYDYLHQEGFEFLADNSYIHSGYRLHYSLKDCVTSLFQFHNETLNVWTHVIGSLIFVGLFIYVCFNQYNAAGSSSLLARCQGSCMSKEPYLFSGRHTKYLFDIVVLKKDQNINCAWIARSNSRYRLANHLFSHSLDQVSVLEKLHNSIPNDVQSSVTSYFNNLREGVLSIKQEIQGLQHRLQEVSAADAQWTLDRVSSLKKQIENRLDKLADYVSKAAEAVRSDVSFKYAMEEYDIFMNRVSHGINAMSSPHNDTPENGNHHVSRWPLFVFIASAVTCLSCSAIFHLLYVTNQQVYFFLSRLDYAGIAVLIAGSFYPVIYYSFYCKPLQVTVYLLVISVLAAITFVFSLTPAFGTPQYLIARTTIFLSLGLFGIFPFSHLIWTYGIQSEHVTVPAGNLVIMGALYIIGAVIYSTKVPERFFPGRFDYLFSSHQLWHIFVVVAALVHFFGSIEHYEWRWDTKCNS